MPIVLGFGTQIIQWIHPVKGLYYLDKNAIILTTAIFTVLFEAVLPLINPLVYAADWIDILMYSAGATAYYQFVSKKVKTEYLIFLENLTND